MPFHKVDPEEEIKKSIEMYPGLEIYIKQVDIQYKLIKLLFKKKRMIL
ncbi:hypothetical protein [Clostridium botulinum]|nr:hypothetical protein [Clostridium botulinum]